MAAAFQAPGYDWAPNEPRVDTSSRESIIGWLGWNDRHGSYTDADCALEGIEPLSLATARDCLRNAWEQSVGDPITFDWELA